MRKLTFILALLTLFAVAQARFFLGLPASSIVTSGGVAAVSGLQFGTYKLYEDFGIRATAEAGAVIGGDLVVEGGLDGTYSFGEGIVFYTGAGLGYTSAGGGGSPYIGAFVGLDFDAGSVVSVFLEINPRYAFANTGLLHVRSGLNFHIGDPNDNPVASRDEDVVWLEPYDDAANP